MANALHLDFPNIAATARLQPNASVINYQKQLCSEDHSFKTDPCIFKVFTYEFLDHTDPGYARDQVIEVDKSTDEEGQRNLQSFETGLQQQSVVQQYSVGASVDVEDLKAGIAMHAWLNNYAYPISLTCWMFLVPVLFVLVKALVDIAQQLIRAALANPVTALRNG